jgi:hypothetical protein
MQQRDRRRKRLDLRWPVNVRSWSAASRSPRKPRPGLYGETWHFVVVTDPEERTAIAVLYRKTADGIFSGGALSFDPYLARLHAVSADDPRLRCSSGEVPVLSYIEGRVETANAWGANFALRLKHASDMVTQDTVLPINPSLP